MDQSDNSYLPCTTTTREEKDSSDQVKKESSPPSNPPHHQANPNPVPRPTRSLETIHSDAHNTILQGKAIWTTRVYNSYNHLSPYNFITLASNIKATLLQYSAHLPEPTLTIYSTQANEIYNFSQNLPSLMVTELNTILAAIHHECDVLDTKIVTCTTEDAVNTMGRSTVERCEKLWVDLLDGMKVRLLRRFQSLYRPLLGLGLGSKVGVEGDRNGIGAGNVALTFVETWKVLAVELAMLLGMEPARYVALGLAEGSSY